MRIRNVSPFGDLIIAGHGVVTHGAEIETDDKTLVDSPHFEKAAGKKKSTRKQPAKRAARRPRSTTPSATAGASPEGNE